MSRPTILAAALSAGAALFAAGAASAQAAPASGQDAGLRYLSWSGRGAVPTTAPAAVQPQAAGVGVTLRRPNLVIPHGGFAQGVPPRPGLTPAPGPRQPGLTPANRWMHPAAPPPDQPASPPAVMDARRSAASAPAPVRTAPEYLPDQGGRGQPVPADVAYAPVAPQPAAAPTTTDPADPMAPRRDAPVFRMQQAAPQPAPMVAPAPAADRAEAAPRVATVAANTDDRPAEAQGSRYYSVHRQAGRQPDPLAIPEPTYVDAMAIHLPETMASQDLAQPPEPPTLIRDNQGRLRAAPAASDGDHQ